MCKNVQKNLVFVAILTLIACPEETNDPNPGEQVIAALHNEGTRLINQSGQEVVLRGINARIEGLFDVTFDDGRIPLETIPPFEEEDYLFIKNELGFNSLRIPINWSGLEPTENGGLDDSYLSVLDGHLALCEKHQIWCIVDVHQDAYSKEIGEDGAPLWAIIPPPEELLEGPLDNLYERRGSEQVLAAFKTFFDGTDGVQDAYLSMLHRLAIHLKDRPYVAGIEIFNEPVADTLEVLQFSALAIETIHEADPNQLVLFEPTSTRNLFDETDPMGGLKLPLTAYAPHLYPEVFSGAGNNFANGDITRLVESTSKAREESDAHDAPLFVTEYGLDPKATNAMLWIETMEAEMDRAHASRYFWVYEELEQDRWGLYDEGKVLREDLASWLARPYPAAIDGELLSFSFDTTLTQFEVRFVGGGVQEIAVPERVFGSDIEILCDGAPVDLVRTQAFVTLSCGSSGDDETHTIMAKTKAQ
jgi:endoglycosylceramidase